MSLIDTPFARPHIDALISLIGANTDRRWPTPALVVTHVVPWEMPGSNPKENIRLWFDDGALIAYGWFQPPDFLHFDVAEGHPKTTSLREQILAWAVDQRRAHPPSDLSLLALQDMGAWADWITNPPVDPVRDRYLTVSSLASDKDRNAFLQASGFAATQHFEPMLVHDLEVDATTIPPGYRVRHVHDDEFEALVATHRDAWAPSTGFSLERYQQVRSFDAFDPELSLVAVSPDGDFCATGTFWADPVSRIGSLEPMGTRPAYRGTGISKALIHEGMRRLKHKGMRAARISTAGFNHPAQALYRSAGCVDVDRSVTHVRVV